MGRPTGFVLYHGPSAIDGAPIVAVVTGLGSAPSQNRKTGAMAQVWILSAGPRNPTEAQADGSDASVCGTCPLRKALRGGCYVNVGQAPGAVYRAWRDGKYPKAPRGLEFSIPLRWGAYGDPAAIPGPVLTRWTARARRGWTGYTHQWRSLDRATARTVKAVCMASVDTAADEREATRRGWRTFRVLPVDGLSDRMADPTLPRAVHCPAVDAGASCASCRLCDGTTGPEDDRRSVVIEAHGSGAGKASKVAAGFERAAQWGRDAATARAR